jgi:4-oxalocrotonate tautomerase
LIDQKREEIMPVVIVEMHEGRTVEQKKQLAEGIAASFAKIGTSPEKVTIIMKDNPRHNWATGGKLASEST